MVLGLFLQKDVLKDVQVGEQVHNKWECIQIRSRNNSTEGQED